VNICVVFFFKGIGAELVIRETVNERRNRYFVRPQYGEARFRSPRVATSTEVVAKRRFPPKF